MASSVRDFHPTHILPYIHRVCIYWFIQLHHGRIPLYFYLLSKFDSEPHSCRPVGVWGRVRELSSSWLLRLHVQSWTERSNSWSFLREADYFLSTKCEESRSWEIGAPPKQGSWSCQILQCNATAKWIARYRFALFPPLVSSWPHPFMGQWHKWAATLMGQSRKLAFSQV